jgi:hypothetical protein
MRDRFFARDATLLRIARRLALMVTLMLSCLIAACAPSMTQRIKVTVTVEDNGTLYTGTAVQQWTCFGDVHIGDKFIGTGGCELKAEAIPIKIGEKGWAFMLLSGNQSEGVSLIQADNYPGAIQAGRSKVDPSMPWSVPFDRAPIFVRFKDLNDRLSIEQVNPQAFDQSFGKGVVLASIKCEVTNERLTHGKVRNLLPWLKEVGGRSLDMTKATSYYDITTVIQGTNFVWGL